VPFELIKYALMVAVSTILLMVMALVILRDKQIKPRN